MAISLTSDLHKLTLILDIDKLIPNLSYLCSFYHYLQNTFTNAERLLETAEQLGQTGECNPDDIYQVAKVLEQKVRNFVSRLECRKSLLDMSVSFHTHAKEVSLCLRLILFLGVVVGVGTCHEENENWPIYLPNFDQKSDPCLYRKSKFLPILIH